MIYIFLLISSLNEEFFLQYIDSYPISESIIINSFNNGFVFNNNKLYYYSIKISDSCSININCISKDKFNNYSIFIPDSLFPNNKCNKNNISYADVSNDSLCILIKEFLLFYSFEVDRYILTRIINLKDIFKINILYYANRIKFINDKIIGINDQFHPKRSDDSQYYYWIIDLKEIKNSTFNLLEKPKGFYWTLFQPRNILDISENGIISSDVTDYRILIYNRNNIVVDSLIRKIDDWNSISYPLNKFLDKHPSYIINSLQKDSNSCSLIHNVHFIDSVTVLVCYSLNNTKENDAQIYYVYYDIWRKNEGKWKLKYNNIDFNKISNEKKVFDFFPLYRNYIISHNKILSFHYDYKNNEQNCIIVRRLRD